MPLAKQSYTLKRNASGKAKLYSKEKWLRQTEDISEGEMAVPKGLHR